MNINIIKAEESKGTLGKLDKISKNKYNNASISKNREYKQNLK